MKIYIRYMVCLRCKAIVIEALKKLGLTAVIQELGMVELDQALNCDQHEALRSYLKPFGLVLLDKNHEVLIEKLEDILSQLMTEDEIFSIDSFEEYLKQKLGISYDNLTSLFAEVNGCTMSHYLMVLKIEKVKELILYDDLLLKDIAVKLHFRNTEQLNRHFKIITGLNPSFFQAIKKKRHSLLMKA